MQLSAWATAALVLAAFAAGLVDAVAGGSGVIAVPALLAAGLPPHLALGTNKAQGVFGTFASTLSYARAGLLDRKRARVTFPLGLAGSLCGAALVLLVRPSTLRPIVLVLLVVAAVVIALRPRLRLARQHNALPVVPAPPRDSIPPGTHAPPRESAPPGTHAVPRESAPPRAHASPRKSALPGPHASRYDPAPFGARAPRLVAATVALVLGCYDGFFGPGAGTFLILALAFLFDLPLQRASADAKPINFASNLAALALFSARGAVLWKLALPMAAAQFAGAFLGAHLAVRGGDRVVRLVMLMVVLTLVAKLAADTFQAP